MQKIYITVIIFGVTMFLLSLVGVVFENFFSGCNGLDQRDCLNYSRCLWHVDKNDLYADGKCISRRNLPEFIKSDLRFEKKMDRYLNRYNPYYYLQDLYYRYRPSYYYTDSSGRSPWNKFNYVSHTLI